MEDLQTYDIDDVIFKEGDPCDYLYIVKSGRVAIVKEDNGRLFFYPNAVEKSFLGQHHLFDGSNHTLSAVALDRTQLVRIKRSQVEKVLSECPDWITDIMNTLSDRLSHSKDYAAEHKINVNEDIDYSPELAARVRKALSEEA